MMKQLLLCLGLLLFLPFVAKAAVIEVGGNDARIISWGTLEAWAKIRQADSVGIGLEGSAIWAGIWGGSGSGNRININRAFLPFKINDPHRIRSAKLRLFVERVDNDWRGGAKSYISVIMPKIESGQIRTGDFTSLVMNGNTIAIGSERIFLRHIGAGRFLEIELNQEAITHLRQGFEWLGVAVGWDIEDIDPGNWSDGQEDRIRILSRENDRSRAAGLLVEYEGELDPVILLPGMMGSQQQASEWLIDPVWHSYDGLIRAIDATDEYGLDRNFFVLPYDWRQPAADTAGMLKDKIDMVKAQSGAEKVDILAHSSGGLIARAYIQSDGYGGDVDRLITLNTPHRGLPGFYPVYEAAAPKGWRDHLQIGILRAEAMMTAPEKGLAEYVRERVPGLLELLPDRAYLYERSGPEAWSLRPYFHGHPRNFFLEDLNAGTGHLAKRVELDSFYSLLPLADTPNSTVGAWRVEAADPEAVDWPHGRAVSALWEPGDGIAPEYSLLGLGPDSSYRLVADCGHDQISEKAQHDIIETLSGQRPTQYYGNFPSAWSILSVFAYAHVDMRIIDPFGQVLGKDFASNEALEQIEGAFYSHFSSPAEFATIPDPAPGQYRVILQATGSGDYGLGVNHLDRYKPDYGDNIVSGRILPGQRRIYEFSLDADTSAEPALTLVKDDILAEFSRSLDLLEAAGAFDRPAAMAFFREQIKTAEKFYNSAQSAESEFAYELNKRLYENSLNLMLKHLDMYVEKKWLSQGDHELLRTVLLEAGN